MDDRSLKLVRRALDGDEPALREVVGLIRPDVHATIAGVLRDHVPRGSWRREDVEDLMQETLLTLFEGDKKLLRAWNPALGLGLPGYVKLVARCRALSFLRRRDNRYWDMEDERETSAEQTARVDEALELDAIQKQLVHRVFAAAEDEMPKDTRPLFRMLFVDALDVKAISDRTGMKPENVHTARSRFLKRLFKAAERVLGAPETG